MNEQQNTDSPTRGAHHVGLTVPDLTTAKSFFIDSLGYEVVGEKPDYPAAFVSDGTTMITLWQAADPAGAVAFDRKNVIGLHHLALKVAGQDELDGLYEKLQSTDSVVIEFAPESLGESATRHFMIAMPGGIRMEFIAPAA